MRDSPHCHRRSPWPGRVAEFCVGLCGCLLETDPKSYEFQEESDNGIDAVSLLDENDRRWR
jgi:hypothetical protein